MDTKLIAVALVSLLVGAGGTFLFINEGNEVPRAGSHMMSNGRMMDDDRSMSGMMNDMMGGLTGKTGDAFDQAFLAEMIVHHEGAVAMAQAARASAKHQEIKDMAEAIISAQTKEIAQMKDWQKSWYSTN